MIKKIVTSSLLLVMLYSEENIENLDKVEVESDKSSIFDTPNYFESQTYIDGAPSQKRMNMTEAMSLPGVMSDPLRAINSMAGVTSPSSFGGEIMIHGSKPYETVYTLNNVPLGYPFHFGGLHSVLSPEAIEQLDVYLGAFDVTYGDAMGGVIDITPKTPIGTNNGHIHAGLFDSSFGVDYKIADNWAIYLGGRRTYYDVVLELLNAEFDGITISTYPNYYDATMMLSYIPDDYNIFTFETITAKDTMNMSVEAQEDADPDAIGAIEMESAFTTYALRWKYDNLTSFKSNTILNYITNTSSTSIFSTISTDTEVSYLQLNNLSTLDLDKHKVSTGFEVKRLSNSYDFEIQLSFINDDTTDDATAFGDIVTTSLSGEVILYQGAAFLQDIYSINENYKLRYGLRGSYLKYQNFGAVFDPRAALIYTNANHSISFATGIYSQMPNAINTIDTIGSSDLSYEHSIHYALNYKYNFDQKSSFEVETFYKDYYDLAISTGDSTNYTSDGVGNAGGIDITYKKRTKGLYLYATYSFLFSNRETSTTSGVENMVDEIPHTLQLAASYDIGDNWVLSGLLKYNTGQLYTPITGTQIKQYSDGSVVNTYVDSSTTYYTAVYSTDQYSKRLPDYFTLNLKVAKTVKYSKNNSLEYSFELMNATNNENVTGYIVSKTTGEISKSTDLPLIPWFDITYRF